MLNKKEQALYDYLEQNIWNYKSSIDIERYYLPINSIRKVQDALYNDNPMMYYMDPYAFNYFSDNGYVKKSL